MRKYLFFFNIVVFSFIFFFLIPAPSAYAACSLSIEGNKTTFSPEFNEDIKIIGNGCFNSVITYTILAYPQNTSSNLYANYPIDRKKTSNPDSVTAKLDLKSGAIGKSNPGTWTIKVCVANTLSECDDSNKILGTIENITVSALTPTSIPIPTDIPAGFPNASFLQKQFCQFKAGEDVLILVENLTPNTRYLWWWYSDSFSLRSPEGHYFRDSSTFSETNSINLDVITIPGSETAKEFQNNPNKKHILCFSYDKRQVFNFACTPGAQNTVEVNLNINETKLCEEGAVNTRGDASSLTLPTSTPVPPALLPCKEGLNEKGKVTENKALIKKCTKIDSAIGEVPTDPAAFIKTIFTVLLSMASGWATYLIITAGYQLMFSGHDAEKVQEARDKITSAIVGLVFMILSLIILRVIGVDIFQLPTFG